VIWPAASAPSVHDRLRGVARNVQNGLDQLLAIADQFRQAGVVVAATISVCRKLRGQQAAHAFENLVDVDRARLHRPMRRKQALHQVLQAVGFLDDDLGVFAQAGIVEFVLEQLRRTANAAQRILDFVRQVADQLAVGLLLLEQRSSRVALIC
jgi:hypothetical protein